MAVLLTSDVNIRWMTRNDLPQVAVIESSRPPVAVDGIWTEQDFIVCLRGENNVAMVVLDRKSNKERIIGFCVYNLQPDKLYIWNFGILPEFRHLSVGRKLLSKMKHKLSPNRRELLEMDIRESDLAMQLFLCEQGFKAVGVVRRFFQTPQVEDAYKFVYALEA